MKEGDYMSSLSTEIDNLYYSTVEREIAHFYDMGMCESSNIPIECSEDTCDTYILIGSKKEGEFNIRIAKQTDGKYWLSASPVGKIKKK